ncbi:tyrosinase family oxidase copper chaperone [Streptomyces sp. NPDC029003]|uniref:apotyrosinase chaperone MelC1 n=1 Tax=Streptomyces sp. NPDC029003 TaxID=3155125 RepID=UPI0034110D23
MNEITRRRALGLAAGAAAVAGLTGCDKAASPSSSPSAPPPATASGPALSIPGGAIDEVYEGRRIQISMEAGGKHNGHPMPGLPTIKIDGKELHLMRNADNSWVTVVHHYETFPDPVSAARAAVRDLQGANLLPFAPAEGTS